MFLKINPIIFTLIFAIALEASVYNESWYFYILLFLVLFSILAIWPLARKIRFLAIPFFLSIGSLNLIILIDQPIEKHAFVFLSTVVYYLALMGAYRLKHYDCDQTAQGMVNLSTLATGFFWFVSNYAWYLNFQIGTWMLVLTFIGSSYLISLPSLKICLTACEKLKKKAKGKKNVWQCPSQKIREISFLNMVIAFLTGQTILILSFWPFAYLTTGVVMLIIYFILWDATRLHIQNNLTRKAVMRNVIFGSFSITLLVLTARWSLII